MTPYQRGYADGYYKTQQHYEEMSDPSYGRGLFQGVDDAESNRRYDDEADFDEAENDFSAVAA